MALASRIINNTDFNVYSGNDDIIVPIMSVGGKGVISVVANIMPEETHNVCIDYLNGETEKSRKQFLSMLDLIDSLFCEVNPVPIKTAMNILGFDVGGVRLPLFEMEDKNIERLKNSLKKCNLI